MQKYTKKSVAVATAALTLFCASASAWASDLNPAPAHSQYGVVKILVPIDVDSPKAFAFRLKNLENSQKAIKAYGGQVIERVVLYGPGVKLFSSPSPDLAAKIDTARNDGVQFRFCKNSLDHFKITPQQMYFVKPSDVVPSGFLEIAYLQNKQWRLDP